MNFFYPRWIFEATVLSQLKNNTVFPKIFSVCLAGSLTALSHLIIVPGLEEVSVINPNAQVKKQARGGWMACSWPHSYWCQSLDAESWFIYISTFYWVSGWCGGTSESLPYNCYFRFLSPLRVWRPQQWQTAVWWLGVSPSLRWIRVGRRILSEPVSHTYLLLLGDQNFHFTS